jgi:hypothetical protein
VIRRTLIELCGLEAESEPIAVGPNVSVSRARLIYPRRVRASSGYSAQRTPSHRDAKRPLPDARRYTGPRTLEGKERSRMANWKHGLRSRGYIEARREARRAMRLLRTIIGGV